MQYIKQYYRGNAAAPMQQSYHPEENSGNYLDEIQLQLDERPEHDGPQQMQQRRGLHKGAEPDELAVKKNFSSPA